MGMKRILSLLLIAVFQLVVGSFALAQGTVSGSVFEQDGTTPIVDASVTFSGIDFQGDTVAYSFLPDSVGVYYGEMNAGVYQAVASAYGYSDCVLPDSVYLSDSLLIEHIDFILYELYDPVQYVMARQLDNAMVKVSWAKGNSALVEDFETGDFTKFDWNNAISDFPWVITETNPYQGSYCMKSSCEGVGSGISEIEVAVNLLVDSRISFCERISSESPWDCGSFYIDDLKMGEYSGENDWQEVAFDVAEGLHIFRWSYVGKIISDKHVGKIGKVINVAGTSVQKHLVVDYNSSEVLIPLSDDLIINESENEILMDLPDGLLNINEN